jgi:hypothetical protein
MATVCVDRKGDCDLPLPIFKVRVILAFLIYLESLSRHHSRIAIPYYFFNGVDEPEMQTNVNKIALSLNITTKAAVDYYRQVREQLHNSVSTDMVRRGVDLYLNRYFETKPSPCALVRFFHEIKTEFWERAEQSEMDYMLSDWIAQEEKKELEEMGWPYEDREILYIATYGYAFGQKPWQDPWELEQQSRADALVLDWLNGRLDEDYDESTQRGENDRRAGIQVICERQEITSLIHFTRRDNLENILQRGLLTRQTLGECAIENVNLNDQHRLDNCSNAICLSISFPNYQMFYKYSCINQSEWVVLELDASILWELDCAFCHENAAAKAVRIVPLERRKTVRALNDLFGDYARIPRAKNRIPRNYTTHPQAEILVFNSIPTGYINAVHFPDETALQPWKSGDERLFWCRFVASPQYFRPRVDYKMWQSTSVRHYETYDEYD